jgi:hypothetical protein
MTRLLLLLPAAAALAAATSDLSAYKESPGLKAAFASDLLTLTWQGAPGQELRASFSIVNGVPLVKELAARNAGGAWAVLGRDLTPEFQVVSGLRRISEQQLAPLRQLNKLDPEFLEQEKWKVFWDAPLQVPGSPKTNPGLPRKAEEIRRASASFEASGCKVKTDGGRIEVFYPGLRMGIFTGGLQYTVYKGTNLLRQEAIASTAEPSVAYKYNAGLKGFRIGAARRVVWRDVARGPQKYEFGGSPNTDPVALRARNRLAIVEPASGSLAVFPAPHKFFFGREIELNLGYVWYRKDDDATFSVGVRQAEHEEMYRPYGFSDEVWRRRSSQARGFATGNFALYNAPPGSMQRMAVYYYLSPQPAAAAREAVLAFTHGDTYKPLPGYKVSVGHFHTHFNEQVADAGSLDFQPPWIPTFRALGINIAMMSDFHGDGHADDPGDPRFNDQKVYFEASRRHSDKDFLIMPGEEPDATFGGHYTMVFPRPVYWSHVRKEGQLFEENHPRFGKVYHVGSPAEELEMLRKEGGLVWQAHPRTKGSSGYPDAIKDTVHFKSDRYLGASYQSLPADLSHSRLCEVRCLELLNDMNNWGAPKYLVAEGDTYAKFPDDETYPHFLVNYIRLDKVPLFDQDWSPVLKSLRAGDFFVTSGEILIRKWSASPNAVEAEIEWTYPLEFVEAVWGDGSTSGRKIVPATSEAPFGSRKFHIPLEGSGNKWVRFAAWDSAGNGAITQPVHWK